MRVGAFKFMGTFAAHARSMLNASQRLQLTEVCVEGLKDSKVEVAAAAQITLIGLLMTCSQAERDQFVAACLKLSSTKLKKKKKKRKRAKEQITTTPPNTVDTDVKEPDVEKSKVKKKEETLPQRLAACRASRVE